MQDVLSQVVAVDIEDSIRMNADCMAVQTSYWSGRAYFESIDNFSRVINAGMWHSIPPRSCRCWKADGKNAEVFRKLATRIVAEMGVQLVKTYDCENFDEVVAACPVPIVVAGGKKLPEIDESLHMMLFQKEQHRKTWGAHSPEYASDTDGAGGWKDCP